MARHIGIVGVSPEGAALCFRQIARHAALALDPHLQPTISVYNLPFSDYLDAIRRDDWRAVGSLLRDSAIKLADAGAEFCFSPDNAVQHAVQLAEVGCPIPWLKMTDAVGEAIAKDGRKTVGVIGTKVVTCGSVYQTDLGIRGIKLVRPDDADTDRLESIIFDELVYGSILEQSRKDLLGIVSRLADRGCEGVILGCSEAPIAITRGESPLPLYNAAEIMAEQAVRHARDAAKA
ncbi:MAG: amino acid racemase [Phycisphaerales bacterium]|nr:amino acid racemase [Planctomycetota bacterium]MCH8508640.1 amino acid racemase [Phycisphaerales bacterium]